MWRIRPRHGHYVVFLEGGGDVFWALSATFEFANQLLYNAVQMGILSKCGLHVMVDLLQLLGCFARE